MTASTVVQGQESAFPKEEYEIRVARARQNLVEAGIDALVVTGPENIFYLTGQQTPGYYTFQALLLPAEGDPVFVIRQLEYFNFIANTFIADAEVYQDGDEPVSFLMALIEKRGLAGKRVAIDKRGWFLPIFVYESLLERLGVVHDGAGVIEKLRAVKSPWKSRSSSAQLPMSMRACGPDLRPSRSVPPITTWSPR